MKRLMCAGLLLVCGSLASGQPAQDASQVLRDACPDVQFFADAGHAQVCGTSLSNGLSAEQSAENFVHASSDMFGVPAAELQPGNAFDAQHVQPLLYDETTGVYKATMVSYRQYKDGIPVYGADVRMLVVNEPPFPLVLANSTLCDLSDFTVPQAANVDVGAAYAAALAFEPGLNNFGPSEVVVWPDLDNKPHAPQLAITFVASGVSSNDEPKMWRFVCSAATGEILHTENMILFTDVSGNVSGLATTIPKAEQCNPEVSTPMRYATVSISGGSSVYADANGNFTIPNSGTSAVTVQSPMGGRYFTMSTASGSLETLSMSVTPPGPANFTHNAANNSENIRAQVNAYVQANIVRDWVLVQNPSYPTIYTQTGFGLNVMLTGGYCPGNAWYDGSSLNFCLAASGYGDTAFSNVVHHEYGHHVVACGGSGQDQYGEGVGDCLAVLLSDDPQLGIGFYTSDCTNGIRNANNTMQYPCTSDIHTCAQLLSGCIWSTRNALVSGGHSDYLTVLAKLMVNSVPLHGSSGSITPAIGTTFVSLDNTYYGGAHVDHIQTGFGAHNMMPAAPPANDACANAIAACPGTVYTGSTSSASVDGSASCGSSSSTPDVWYKYTPGTSGSATFSLCGTGTTYDSVLSVHTGCPGTSSNQIGCDDDGCGTSGGPSSVTASVTAGTTYYIRISGWSSRTGAYSLSITGPACGGGTTYTLTTAVSPAGAGSITLNPSGGTYPSGTVVTVTANAGSGYVFSNWTGDLSGSTNPTTITMNGNKSVTAVFTAAPTYTLTTAVSPAGSGTITLNPPGGTYAAGTVVTVTANAGSGYAFSQWTGDLTGSTNPTTITMNSNKSVTAVFTTSGESVRYEWLMDTNPGWTKSPNTTANKWAWGIPTGGGGQHGYHDPTSGHTGTRVMGYNLSGDYANNLAQHHITTGAINCTGLTNCKLRFWRWLGVEQPAYDHAYVRVSNNGSTWTTVWQNTAEVADSGWVQVEYNISSVADNKPTVYIRWTMGTTDSSWQYCGWNIDDVQIVATGALYMTDGSELQAEAVSRSAAVLEGEEEE
ncbi:MAG TPA: hypothetical protein VMV94_01175 [Phycisphaerae bacterium]|nr:hypothetical protein [Phycisphaerae bacterium]